MNGIETVSQPQPTNPSSPELKKILMDPRLLGVDSMRFKRLDRFEAHYACRQYDHLKIDWWGQSADQMETISPIVQVPLGFTQPAYAMSVRTKRPTAPFNLCKTIVDRFTGLLLSEVRKPDVVVEGDPESESWFAAFMEQSLFWSRWREARTVGGATGTVVVTAHVRDGQWAVEVHNPKHLTPLWADRRTLTLAAILKQWVFTVMEAEIDERTKRPTGQLRPVSYLYRRIISNVDDTVFKPCKLDPNVPPLWEIESQAVHNLGYFPGTWVQNLAKPDDVDGDPDCQGVWQNFDTIDRLTAQMNKAILLNLDPTLVTSIDPRVIEMQGGQIRKGSDNSINVGPGGSASYLEISGQGVSVGMEVLKRIVQNTLDVTRTILVDPGKTSGAAQSAKAIEYIYAPMLEKADDLRAQYGELGILRLLRVVDRMARDLSQRTVEVLDEAGNKVQAQVGFNMPPRVGSDGSLEETKLGPGGFIRLRWPSYFAPTEDDRQLALQNIVTAKSAGLLDEETAVRAAAKLFGVRDPSNMVKKIKAEREEQMASMLGSGVSDWDSGPVVDAEANPAVPMPKQLGEVPDKGPGAGGKP